MMKTVAKVAGPAAAALSRRSSRRAPSTSDRLPDTSALGLGVRRNPRDSTSTAKAAKTRASRKATTVISGVKKDSRQLSTTSSRGRSSKRSKSSEQEASGQATPALLDAEAQPIAGSPPAKSKKGKGSGDGGSKGGPTWEYERKRWQAGQSRVAGVDEAGRGPLAGPVVAAACVIPQGVQVAGLDDSKKLTEAQRDELYRVLVNHPEVDHSVSIVPEQQIDRLNILQATMASMTEAVEGLPNGAPHHVMIDGPHVPAGIKDPSKTWSSEAVVKGDGKSCSIAAASIIAKVTRDAIMVEMDAKYPQYGFAKHKGYGTAAHRAAIKAHGPCQIHRWSFAPIKGNYPPPPGHPFE